MRKGQSAAHPMKTRITSLVALVASLVAASAATNYAIQPVLHPGTEKRHESFNVISKQGEAQLVFLGDSITHGWDGKGKAVWEKTWASVATAPSTFFGAWKTVTSTASSRRKSCS